MRTTFYSYPTEEKLPSKQSGNFFDNRGNWKLTLLQQHFCQADVDSIQSIHISPRKQDDFISWPWEKTENFSVKSAYNFAMSEYNLQFVPGASS